MADQSFKIYRAISDTNVYNLCEFFDENIQIKSDLGNIHNGSKEAITFFEEFFIMYKSNSKMVLIFCRFIDEYGCSPMLDEQFKEYSATHDFFIYVKKGKIIRLEIFPSVSFSMRFYVDEIDYK